MLEIELRGFGDLYQIFKKRGWNNPHSLKTKKGCNLQQLLEDLKLDFILVEAVMVNGRVQSLDYAIKDQDRIALIPPGTPGPYRVLLGLARKNPDLKS